MLSIIEGFRSQPQMVKRELDIGQQLRKESLETTSMYILDGSKRSGPTNQIWNITQHFSVVESPGNNTKMVSNCWQCNYRAHCNKIEFDFYRVLSPVCYLFEFSWEFLEILFKMHIKNRLFPACQFCSVWDAIVFPKSHSNLLSFWIFVINQLDNNHYFPL